MGRKKERAGIVFLNEQMKLAERLLWDGEQAQLYRALRKYAMEGKLELPKDASDAWMAVFDMMRAAQDDAIRKYDDTCERNRASALLRAQREAAHAANIRKENKIKENKKEDNVFPALMGQGRTAGNEDDEREDKARAQAHAVKEAADDDIQWC